jgi:hypothetical protein
MKHLKMKLTTICFFSLIQIGLQAQKTTSMNLEINSPTIIEKSIIIYPNPMQGKSTVAFTTRQEGYIQIYVLNIDGKKDISFSKNLHKGKNSFQLSLPFGVYIINVKGKDFSYTTKIISQSDLNTKPEIIYQENFVTENNVELSVSNLTDKTTIRKKSPSTYPVLTTAEVSLISYSTATSGGGFTSTGSYYVVNKGICWNTAQNPTTANNKTVMGSGYVAFTCNITGLSPSTTYYVRSYALTTDNNTTYGNEVSFTTSTIVLPVITTNEASTITATTATSGGDFTSTGSYYVVNKGVCWNTAQNPTTANNKTVMSSGYVPFTCNITGLTHSTTYYVRSYALTTDNNTTYGNEVSFTTMDATTAVLATNIATSITSTSAISGGSISSDGGTPITARGVCWSLSTNPTTSNSKTINGTGTGSFTSQLTGLTLGSTYYIRAYAINNAGTAYGSQVSFKTVLAVGDSFEGGIVAHIFASNEIGYVVDETHGLIAAPSDMSGDTWNTSVIYCRDLVLNSYSDWRLPSLLELNNLYENKDAIGGFICNQMPYWSSTVYTSDNEYAWFQDFLTSYTGISPKMSLYRCRAVRSF